jgi:hypothetical protein
MSNENSNKPVDRNPIRRRIHPIWRGIGFLMIILIPIMGYATATMVMDENHKQNWFPIPKQILGPSNDPELYMRLIITAVISFILYGLLTLVAVILLKLLSPSRYGPTDAPPGSFKGKQYKR